MPTELPEGEKRRSVLWINHFAVAPSEGGGTRHAELGRELARRGWKVTIAASDMNLHTRQFTRRRDAADRTSIPERVENVEFRWLWAAPYIRNDWRRILNWLTFARSACEPANVGVAPDVVIGSSPHLFAALAGARLARRFKVPFVLEVRDLWPESLIAAGGRRGVGYYLFEAIASHLYRKADRIIVLARGTGDYLTRRGVDEKKVVYVPNGVDVDAFGNAPHVGDIAQRPFTLVYAGAHGPANGLDVLLGAAERLGHRSDIRILLVGDGPGKAELERFARERSLANVEFRPPVPKREVPALLASADAGLMVLRDSPLFAFGVSPNKLFDYFGAGLPVVCNVPGDVATMLREAGAGVQATGPSSDALADAILRLRHMLPEERNAMGASGRGWVAREHGRPVLAARMDVMLRALIGR